MYLLEEDIMGRFGVGMNRQTLGAGVLGAILLLIAVVLAPGAAKGTTPGPDGCTNAATLSGSAFEIDTDANLVVNTTNCIDWLTGGTGTSMRSGVLAKNDKLTGTGDDSFGQGTAENNPNPTIVAG